MRSQKMRLLKGLFIVSGCLVSSLLQSSPFDLAFLNQQQRAAFLAGPLEMREQQLAELLTQQKELAQQAASAKRDIKQQATRVSDKISQLELDIKGARESARSILTQTLDKLNERRHALRASLEAWGEAEEILQQHIKLVEQIIEQLKIKRPSGGDSLYLKDLKEAYAERESLRQQLRDEMAKKGTLVRQKSTEEDDKNVFQKRIDEAEDNLRKLAEEQRKSQPDQLPVRDRRPSFEQQGDLFKVTSAYWTDQKKYIEIDIKKLELATRLSEDRVRWFENEIESLSKRIEHILDRLHINPEDVTAAKEDASRMRLESHKMRDAIAKKREEKKRDIRHWRADYMRLDAACKQLKEEVKEETPQGIATIAQFKSIDNLMQAIEKEIAALGVSEEIEDTKSQVKELQARLVEIGFLLQARSFNSEDVERWAAEFNKLKLKEETERRLISDKQLLIDVAILKQKMEEVQREMERYATQKEALFGANEQLYVETMDHLRNTSRSIERQIDAGRELLQNFAELSRYKFEILSQVALILKVIDKKRQFDIWTPSPSAITWREFAAALLDGSGFFKEMFWWLPTYLNPVVMFGVLQVANRWDLLGMLLLLLIFAGFFFLCRRVLALCAARYANISGQDESLLRLIIGACGTILRVLHEHDTLFLLWLIVQLDVLFDFRRFLGSLGTFRWYTQSPYLMALFYLVSIPVLIALGTYLIDAFRAFNRERRFALFPEEFEEQYFAILGTVVYATAVLMPFRAGFMWWIGGSKLPVVLLAAYTLILQISVVALFFLHKEDLLWLLPTNNTALRWIKEAIDHHYYPVCLFLLALLIIANPYVGYSNLAYLMLYAVPISVLFIYGLLVFHFYLRKYSASWFIAEEDDEVIDRFEHAKTYYGIFVTLSFLLLGILVVMSVTFVWGVREPFALMQELLFDRWTILLADGTKLGLPQFVVMALFIASGFLASTLVDKFILNKFFDIVRMDPGVRNTTSSLVHYAIIYLVMVIGLTAINLGGTIFWISTGLFLSLAYVSQDLLKDFVAGFLILLERPIEIGNFIQVENLFGAPRTLGTVHKISPRTTTIRTIMNHLVIIPNKDLVSKPIANWGYGRTTVGFELNVHVTYGTNIPLVFKLLGEVVEEDARILRLPAPVFRLEEFGESGLVFYIRGYISARRVREQWDIASALRANIVKAFDAHGIIIPYPHRILHVAYSKTHSDASAASSAQGKPPFSIKFDEQE